MVARWHRERERGFRRRVNDGVVARTAYRPWLDRVFPVGGLVTVAALVGVQWWGGAVAVGLVAAAVWAWPLTLHRRARRMAKQPDAVGCWWAVLEWPDDLGDRRPRAWAQLLLWGHLWVYLQATRAGLRIIPGKAARRVGGFPITTLTWTQIAGAFEVRITNQPLGFLAVQQHAEICLEVADVGPEEFRLPTPEEVSVEEWTPAALAECEQSVRAAGREIVGDRYRVGTFPWLIYTRPATDLVQVVSSRARAGR